jgi:hypothetical protein
MLRVIDTHSFSELGPFRRTIMIESVTQLDGICLANATVKVRYAKYSMSERATYAFRLDGAVCAIDLDDCALTKVINLDNQTAADVLGELWVDVLDNTGVAADEPAAKKIELKRGCGPYSLVKIKGETFQVAFENRIVLIDGSATCSAPSTRCRR